jgi:preprotein translocase subunit YajC
MLISTAYAQSMAGLPQQLMSSPLPMLVLIFGVFYFFMIRPQQQKAKQLRTAQAALRRGDKVITQAGFLGTVSRVVDDQTVEVEIAEGVKVKVVRSTITTITAKTEPAQADKAPKGKADKATVKDDAKPADNEKVGDEG